MIPIILKLDKERNDECVELPRSNHVHLYTTQDSDPIKGIFLKFSLGEDPIDLSYFNPLVRDIPFDRIFLTHKPKKGKLHIVSLIGANSC